jgi:hypothetical protein
MTFRLTRTKTHDINPAAMNRLSLSRDWLAVLLALAAVALVKSGLLPPIPW